MASGKQISFLELLKDSVQIVIPIIQRDYAQGRIDTIGQSLYQEVRENFIDQLKKALENDKPLVLDYIYGSLENGFFYPVDGQQRLTTLFLLHWYVGIKEKSLDTPCEDTSYREMLKKFSYATRDTAQEFCLALCDMDFDFSNIEDLSKAIQNATSYFHAYDQDPTVQSMLVMLDKIHLEFKDTEHALWSRLNNITFWCLYLEKFGLTDDLFVKMNARGKRLSRFDLFKAELESALDKRLKHESENIKLESAIKRWQTNIDNAYLDYFWQEYGKDGAERNMFRLLMFMIKCTNSVCGSQEYDERWERQDLTASYKKEVEMLAADESLLEILCAALDTFPTWKDKDCLVESLLPKNFDDIKEFYHYQRVILFGIIYWYALNGVQKDKEFNQFYRVLKNLIYANREYNNKTRQFNSSIDGKRIHSSLSLVKKLIDGYCASSGIDFYEYIKGTTDNSLQYEREKLHYHDLAEIEKLEQSTVLNRSIHNFFLNGKIFIKAEELNSILQDKTAINLCLRIILSYAGEQYGSFNNLVFDGTNMQSGKRQLYYNSEVDKATAYCHKYFLKEAENGFGDKVFTADNRGSLADLSIAAQKFANEFYAKYYISNNAQLDINEVLQTILNERLIHEDFSNSKNILWYIVKYTEFFYDLDSTTFLVLRRKRYGYASDDDNVYDIRCTDQNFNIYNMHYQPFYLALCNYLSKHNSKITVDEKNLKISGNQIEFAHPCKLSNDWVVKIEHDGDWKIIFNGNLPKDAILSKYSIDTTATEYVLKNNKSDCIEHLGKFIIECNPVSTNNN
ncbi:MAG: DUF262 domain-containing protein [Clostridiales bacterium]|nr:DUF262 domain-containing protein [Clostridiales bacterium]